MNISLFFISSIWKIKALEHDCHVCCPTYTSVSLIIKPVHVVHLWWCVWLILVKEPAALPTLKPDVVQTIVANVQLSSLMTTTTLSIVLQVSFNTKGRVSIGHSCSQSCDPFVHRRAAPNYVFFFSIGKSFFTFLHHSTSALIIWQLWK